jgi:isoamylase
MDESHWQDPNIRCLGMLLDGRAQTTGIRQRGKEATLLLIFNGSGDPVDFTIPDYPEREQWLRLIDTNVPEDEQHSFTSGEIYTVTPRSLLLFALEAPQS